LTADDNKWWIDILYGVIGALWVGLGVAWGYVWKEVAMKRWVIDQIGKQQEADFQHDRQLIADLLAPMTVEIASIKEQTDQRHGQNIAMLEEILRTVKHHGN
jgi:hypothetical protein